MCHTTGVTEVTCYVFRVPGSRVDGVKKQKMSNRTSIDIEQTPDWQRNWRSFLRENELAVLEMVEGCTRSSSMRQECWPSMMVSKKIGLYTRIFASGYMPRIGNL